MSPLNTAVKPLWVCQLRFSSASRSILIWLFSAVNIPRCPVNASFRENGRHNSMRVVGHDLSRWHACVVTHCWWYAPARRARRPYLCAMALRSCALAECVRCAVPAEAHPDVRYYACRGLMAHSDFLWSQRARRLCSPHRKTPICCEHQ